MKYKRTGCSGAVFTDWEKRENLGRRLQLVQSARQPDVWIVMSAQGDTMSSAKSKMDEGSLHQMWKGRPFENSIKKTQEGDTNQPKVQDNLTDGGHT